MEGRSIRSAADRGALPPSAARAAMLVICAACLAAGCGTSNQSDGSAGGALDEPFAAALADSLRGVLVKHYEVPATSQKDVYIVAGERDSVAGYVVRISVPYELVAKHTLPHEWLREELLNHDWTLVMKADDRDGATYRATRGPALVTVEATWDDTQPPANVPDWYALTVGIPSRAER